VRGEGGGKENTSTMGQKPPAVGEWAAGMDPNDRGEGERQRSVRKADSVQEERTVWQSSTWSVGKGWSKKASSDGGACPRRRRCSFSMK
jgi:hypothetical protein